MATLSQPPVRPRWWQNEDWLAVIAGGLLIAAVVAFWRRVLPGFNWMTAAHFAARTLHLYANHGLRHHLVQDLTITLS